MVSAKSLVVALSTLSFAAALNVGLPLYSWPSDGAWKPTFQVIASNPNTTFDIIINPDNGPGSFPPDPDYIAGVSKLNSYKNVNLYGYIHSLYGKRPLAQLQADVKTYSKWPKYKASNLSLRGIFVDESTEDTAQLNYMKKLGASIRTTMPAAARRIWTNPGVVVDARFYAYADTVNFFEDSWTVWQATGSKLLPAALHANSSVMILGYNGTAAVLATQAQKLVNAGYRSGFVMNDSSYEVFDPVWGKFAADVMNC
ncbi:hypothetical protein MBLNU459_g0822t1 [Dothideomycetes sp. NU459]